MDFTKPASFTETLLNSHSKLHIDYANLLDRYAQCQNELQNLQHSHNFIVAENERLRSMIGEEPVTPIRKKRPAIQPINQSKPKEKDGFGSTPVQQGFGFGSNPPASNPPVEKSGFNGGSGFVGTGFGGFGTEIEK